MEELKRIVEALLFASPDPLTLGRIKSIVPGVETEEISGAVDEVAEDYRRDGRSFQIVEIGGGYQLTTKPDYAVWVGHLLESRSTQKLSKAAMETLAIVAYKQPVLRSVIESVRGVNVDGVLRTLMERGLVKMMGRGEGPGRPLLFGTTRDFLMRFGLSRLGDLPKMEEIEQLVGTAAGEVGDSALLGEATVRAGEPGLPVGDATDVEAPEQDGCEQESGSATSSEPAGGAGSGPETHADQTETQ